MDLKYHIGGDGDFRALDQAVAKINRVQDGQEAVARLSAALAQREFDRLPALEKIVQLKERERKLLDESARQQTQGNVGAAANLALEALRTREQREAIILRLQREQADALEKAARAQAQAADEAVRKAEAAAREQAQAAEAAAREAAAQERRAAAEKLTREQQASRERERLMAAEHAAREAAAREAEARAARAARDQLAREQQANRERERIMAATAAANEAAARQAARDAQRMVDFAERARRARVTEGLRTGAASKGGEYGAADLAGLIGLPVGIAAVIATITAAFRQMLGMVGQVKDSAEQLNLTVIEVQQASRALRDQGQDVGNLGVALSQLGAARREAAEGNEELLQSFARFGVSLDDLNNPALRNIDLIKQMSAATRDLSDADRDRLRSLLGRGGDKLAGAVAGLGSVKADDVMSPEVIERVDQAGKAISKFGRTLMELSAANYANWLDATQPFFDIALLNYGGQHAPKQFKSQEQRDRSAFNLDDIAIIERRMTEDQASPEYKRYKAFQTAQAANPELRLDYDTFNRANSKKDQAKLYQDKVAAAAADRVRVEGLAAGEQALRNAERRHELELSMMSVEERRNALARDREMLLLQIAELNEGLEKEQKQGALIELDARIRALKDDTSTALAPVSTDSLRRIGGFTGGVGGNDPVATRLDAIKALMSGNGREFAALRQALQNGVAVSIKA